MNISLSNIRWLRILGAAVGVIVVSFIIPMIVITVYAFILAFQARGAPDQTAINHFAAWISPRLIPILEIVFTFAAAFIVTRRTATTRILHGLLIGMFTALLGTGVALVFSSHLGLRSLIYCIFTVALGYLGGFVRQKMSVSACP